MKKLFSTRKRVLKKFAALTTNSSLASAVLLLTSCATEIAHWDAVQMRRHVIDYYNDEIMDNLIRAYKRLPFVHVDITSLSANSNSKLAGTVNGGQTLNNTNMTQRTNQIVRTGMNGTSSTVGTSMSHMVAGTLGVVATAMNMATRPFTVSVNPEHSDNLTVVANPVLGTKDSDVAALYNLYVCYAKKIIATTDNPNSLTPDSDYVPGTMKRWEDCHYYYVPKGSKDEYFQLCMEIFTKARPKPATLIQTTPVLVQ
jgi:hypothetical protein